MSETVIYHGLKFKTIDTVPRDGSHVLAIAMDKGNFGYCQPHPAKPFDAADIVHWFDDGLYSSTFGAPQDTPFTHFTHWRYYDRQMPN